MAEQRFFISHDGQQLGPWAIGEIVLKLKRNELTTVDYIFIEEKNDWEAIMNFEPIMNLIADNKPKSRPTPPSVQPSQNETKAAAPAPAEASEQWYVLKGQNKFGPYSLHDVVQMLQEKMIYEFDFIWSKNIATWKRIAEIPAFKPENIKKLVSSDAFFRRKYPRIKYEGSVLVHDNIKVWKGQGLELSAGGAGVVIENAMILPGQMINLHFRPGNGIPPFNASCEVVSKQFTTAIFDHNAPVRYGLKFKSINQNTQKFLQDYSKRGKAA